jgi:hypothetical protein
MNLRTFLEDRERELVKEIDQLHAKLSPLEAELAEVRRAKAALGLAGPSTVTFATGPWSNASFATSVRVID